jgi:hypothetical protein
VRILPLRLTPVGRAASSSPHPSAGCGDLFAENDVYISKFSGLYSDPAGAKVSEVLKSSQPDSSLIPASKNQAFSCASPESA